MSKELFVSRAKEYFGKDYQEYLSLLDKPYTQGFFLNTNKASRDEILRLIVFPYHKSDLTDDSFYHDHNNIGKTIVNDLGLIYPQEIASSLTSKYIDTKDVKTVVDMCSAPGGKTINILNRLDKDVLCISNDINHTRSLIMSQNFERLGLDNIVVTNKKCDVLADQLENYADVVILDAPCSGEGIVRKYPELLDEYSQERIDELSCIQEELLDDAYRILKGNGQLIYSTCTYAFEEDEKQIERFLEKYKDMSIVDIKLDSHSKLKGTVKLSPLNNTEGQFFCILRKAQNKLNSHVSLLKTVKEKLVDDFIKDNFNIDNYYLYLYNNSYYLSLIPLPDLGNNILKYGIKVGEIKNNRLDINHNLYRANSLIGRYKYVYELNLDEYYKYIEGYELKVDLDDNYYLLTYNNHSLGFGKVSKNSLKNKYPKGLRRMV